MSRRRLGTVALALLAVSWALLMQAPGANQNAHLALVTSLSHGTPRIDRYRNWTGDLAYIDGHYYAAKAPGLALTTLPWYLGLDTAGLVVKGPPASTPWPEAQAAMPRTAVWEVGLFGATLPAFVLLLFARFVADSFVPGYGTAAGVVVGAGSLLGVLATMFIAHELSACLGFAAFALLVRERSGPPDARLVAAAGLAAGLAVVVEFPLAIVAAAAGLYAIVRPGWPRRVLAFVGGVIVGLAPLIAFNTRAFGSPTTLSYTNAVLRPGVSGHDVVGANASGFFGVGVPSLRAGLELLFSAKGLVVLAPVCALASVGLVVLWRRRIRAEAAVAGSIGAAFLVYNAGYYLPFAGFPPGPRLLVPMLPFLALPIAAAWQALPGTTLVLALASVVVTSAALLAQPLGPSEDSGSWFHRLEHGDVTSTVFHWAWGDGAAQVLPVVLLLVAAVTVALLVTPRPRIDAVGLLIGLTALSAWRVVYTGAPIMLRVDRMNGGVLGAVGVLGLVAAIALCFVLLERRRFLALVPALALAPIAWPRFAAHTVLSLVAVCVALLGLVVLTWRRRPAPATAS